MFDCAFPRGFSRLLFCLWLWSVSGCVTMLAPQYAPKAEVTLGGTAILGEFRYLPHEESIARAATAQPPAGSSDPRYTTSLTPQSVAANQLGSSSNRDIRLAENIADFVRHAVALELRAAEVKLAADAPIVVSGDIEKFEVDEPTAVTVVWRVVVRVRIERVADRALVLDERFEGDLSYGKLGATWELTNFPSAVLAASLARFLRSEKLRLILSAPT